MDGVLFICICYVTWSFILRVMGRVVCLGLAVVAGVRT